MTRKMPVQKPGRSVQEVGTPDWFIKLCERTWGPILLDVAASEENHVCETYITKEQDALKQPYWLCEAGGVIWCNPPFAKIRPWVERAEATAMHSVMLVLVPAAVGSNWWADHVHNKAAVYFIRPRLVFKGHEQGYPKDLALLVYGAEAPSYQCIRVTEQDLDAMIEQEPSKYAA